jgi:hypothetical protein
MQNNPVFELLNSSQALIADFDHWTKGAYARTANDDDVIGGEDPRACKWCTLGAMYHITGGDYTNTMDIAIDLLAEAAGVGNTHIADYNDEHTHAEVMAMFEKAKELALQ